MLLVDKQKTALSPSYFEGDSDESIEQILQSGIRLHTHSVCIPVFLCPFLSSDGSGVRVP